MDTYKSNPSFADAKTKAKVNEEYETVEQKVSDKTISMGVGKMHICQGEPGGRDTVGFCERAGGDHAKDARPSE